MTTKPFPAPDDAAKPDAGTRTLIERLYRTMARIRAFEDAAEAASQGGVSAYGQAASGAARVRGPLHLSTGQEAVPAGVCAHLTPQDDLTSTHRGHGHTLAKGADMRRMMAELYGKATGFNGGRGGSMHIADFSVGMLGANGVVAAGLPIAAGAAHARKLLGKPGLTACFFGDGAINRGPFLEALNWARVFELPVLFVCEDNRWSATTESDSLAAGDGAAARAAALDIASMRVDGNDVLAVHESAGMLAASVRSGGGPRLLHAITHRVKGHVSVDMQGYRAPSDLSLALANDPLVRMRDRHAAIGGDASRLDAIDRDARTEVDDAIEFAESSPWPEAAAAYTEVHDTGAGTWF